GVRLLQPPQYCALDVRPSAQRWRIVDRRIILAAALAVDYWVGVPRLRVSRPARSLHRRRAGVSLAARTALLLRIENSRRNRPAGRSALHHARRNVCRDLSDGRAGLHPHGSARISTGSSEAERKTPDPSRT